jgi:hypothetical protein
MKRISLLILACTSSLNAEISYEKLYAQTAAITGGIALAGYGFSKLCYCPDNKLWAQGIGCTLGALTGAAYYQWMHPETRMTSNTSSFQSAWNSSLFELIKDHAITGDLMRQLSVYYIDARNPFYDAFEDILKLKTQFISIIKESKLLLTFYSLDCYKNESYAKRLELQIELSQKAIELITKVLVTIKSTPEYRDAVNLQVQIEKQKAMEMMALAQQTQAFNSYRPSTIIIS